MMSTTAHPLGAEGGQIDRAHHDLLAGAGVGLGEDPAVIIHDHAAAGP
jgi:hypothetical protein